MKSVAKWRQRVCPKSIIRGRKETDKPSPEAVKLAAKLGGSTRRQSGRRAGG